MLPEFLNPKDPPGLVLTYLFNMKSVHHQITTVKDSQDLVG